MITFLCRPTTLYIIARAVERSTALAIIYYVVGRQRNLGLNLRETSERINFNVIDKKTINLTTVYILISDVFFS
jgi:hypothetical protein